MRSILRYLTHPQVTVQPDVAVPHWGLSPLGAKRVRALTASGRLKGTTQIISSAENKAVETAEPIANALRIPLEIRPAMHENDRSATGFLPEAEFQQTANQFFAKPNKNIRGWERANDAQTRIVTEADTILGRQQQGDILMVGHGAVGTLLYCHYAQQPIDRAYDQSGDGGNYFAITIADRSVIHSWKPMEDLLT